MRYDRELAIAMQAAKEAGTLARSLQGTVELRRKADGSEVSDADLAADAVIQQALRLHFPDDAILSEEVADDGARTGASRLWIIDPIDGTREYLGGRDGWAVQIALAVDGVLVLGVVAVPAEGVVLAGAPGVGAWIADADGTRPLAPAAGAEDVLVLSTSSRNREAGDRVRAALPEFRVETSTSVGVKTWRILAGRAGLYIYPKSIAEWDAAAPAALLAGAGGHATDLAGRALAFNTPGGRCPGLLFSKLPGHGTLVQRLAAAGIACA